MKVLIVDDERHIRKGLESNIDWNTLGIEVVLTAEEGEEALRLCREKRPEILISDIRMPGVDGLELAAEAVEKCGIRKVILLSGYSEFEYAKKAISLGVSDYLLKPVNLQELTELLEKSIEEIYREERQKQIIREREIKQILENRGGGNRIGSLIYGENKKYPEELVVITIEKNWIYGIAKEEEGRISEKFSLNNTRILFREEEKVVLLMELNGSAARRGYRQDINAQMQQFKKDLEYTAGVSDRGKIADICSLYQQSKEALKHRLYRQQPVCLFFDEVKESQERVYPLLHFEKEAIKESVVFIQVKRLNELIHKQFMYLYEKRCTDVHAPIELCTAIQNAVFEAMQEKGVDIVGIMDKNQNLFQNQMQFSLLESYERWIDDYCGLLLRGLEDLSGKKYSSVISRAVDYIQQHYQEDITLKSVAEEVKKSSSYFSSIFKKEMGINFNEYLNCVRIRKAKQLLKKPDVVIYQVAEQTGFHDYKYFIKVFKKICGCSPGEYSRGIQNEKS